MPLAAVKAATAHAPKSTSSNRASAPARLRLLLAAGCIASVALAAWAGEPAGYLRADPELAFLLRGMAVIKAAIVLAALGVLFWRFGHPVSQRTALAYLIGAWLTAGASVLIWQLSFIPLAALGFHLGEFTLLVVAWRDHRGKSQRAEGATNTPIEGMPKGLRLVSARSIEPQARVGLRCSAVRRTK